MQRRSDAAGLSPRAADAIRTTTLVLVGYLLGSIPFQGGTGVATTFGVFTLPSPLAAAFAAGVFGVAVCTTRSSVIGGDPPALPGRHPEFDSSGNR